MDLANLVKTEKTRHRGTATAFDRTDMLRLAATFMTALTLLVSPAIKQNFETAGMRNTTKIEWAAQATETAALDSSCEGPSPLDRAATLRAAGIYDNRLWGSLWVCFSLGFAALLGYVAPREF